MAGWTSRSAVFREGFPNTKILLRLEEDPESRERCVSEIQSDRDKVEALLEGSRRFNLEMILGMETPSLVERKMISEASTCWQLMGPGSKSSGIGEETEEEAATVLPPKRSRNCWKAVDRRKEWPI